jgi:signal transduction histidine kinase/ActR/RegA family two-component response regulator
LLNKPNAEEFSEADERLAATLATQVGIAYENAMLYSDAQRHASELQLEITERKQAEEERAKLLVREQAAREEAEQANRTKDEFLATLSHELRTPLTAILGWSHLVRTGSLDKSQLNRAVETIERNARSQSQLIDDLLDVSRIITGKLQIEPVKLDLCTVVESAIEAVRPSFEAKNIHLTTSMASEGCLVAGDANRLQQIFWNLLSNAIKFTPEGGSVRVEVKEKKQDLLVAVTDSGSGITAEFLPYIFDRFRQADGSTTRMHGGLGLGLSIVKHLVQLHGGKVKVKSDGKDKGSTFMVTLPLVSSAASLAPEDTAAVEASGNGVAPGFLKILKGLRVLVVDDEADSRDLVSAILTRCGSDVNCCESAAEGMKAFKSWKPDLLVSDIGMPVEDGYSLITKLRKLKTKRAKEMPAIALTAYATKEDQARTLSSGFQIHVAKPIDPEILITSIAKAMGSKVGPGKEILR